MLAFPALDPSHTQRIESARANRDDLSRASVPLHFTLVFATDAIERDALAEHVRGTTQAFRPIRFDTPTNDVVWDPKVELWLFQLLPERGAEQIAELHDSLYSGLLAPELRTDIPYAPHITVVASKRKDDCISAQAALDERRSPIAGSINALDVVEYDGANVTTVSRIDLTG